MHAATLNDDTNSMRTVLRRGETYFIEHASFGKRLIDKAGTVLWAEAETAALFGEVGGDSNIC
jgi:hypothetical protein